MVDQKSGAQMREVLIIRNEVRRRLWARFSPTAIWTTQSTDGPTPTDEMASPIPTSPSSNSTSMATSPPSYPSSSHPSSSTSLILSTLSPTWAKQSSSLASSRTTGISTTQSASDSGAKMIDYPNEGAVIIAISAGMLLLAMAVVILIATLCRRRNMKARKARRNTLTIFPSKFVSGNSSSSNSLQHTKEYKGTSATVTTHSGSNFTSPIWSLNTDATAPGTGSAPLSPLSTNFRRRDSHMGNHDEEMTEGPLSPGIPIRFDPSLAHPKVNGAPRWSPVWRSIDEEAAGGSGDQQHIARDLHESNDRAMFSNGSARRSVPRPKANHHSRPSVSASQFMDYQVVLGLGPRPSEASLDTLMTDITLGDFPQPPVTVPPTSRNAV